MDNKRIAEIRERCDAATEGPWRAVDCGVGEEIVIDANGEHIVNAPDRDALDSCMPNITFIAHARQDLPDALDALAAEREKVNEYRDSACSLQHDLDAALQNEDKPDG